MKRMIESTNV